MYSTSLVITNKTLGLTNIHSEKVTAQRQIQWRLEGSAALTFLPQSSVIMKNWNNHRSECVLLGKYLLEKVQGNKCRTARRAHQGRGAEIKTKGRARLYKYRDKIQVKINTLKLWNNILNLNERGRGKPTRLEDTGKTEGKERAGKYW